MNQIKTQKSLPNLAFKGIMEDTCNFALDFAQLNGCSKRSLYLSWCHWKSEVEQTCRDTNSRQRPGCLSTPGLYVPFERICLPELFHHNGTVQIDLNVVAQCCVSWSMQTMRKVIGCFWLWKEMQGNMWACFSARNSATSQLVSSIAVQSTILRLDESAVVAINEVVRSLFFGRGLHSKWLTTRLLQKKDPFEIFGDWKLSNVKAAKLLQVL